MKIALCVGTLHVGGTETQLVRLASELSAQGHDVKVFAVAEGGPLSETLDQAGVPWEVFGYTGLRFRDECGRRRPRVAIDELRKVARFWSALRAFRPDVCHAFLYWSYILSLPGAVFARVPVRVIGRRGSAPEIKRARVVHVALRRLAAGCSHVVVSNAALSPEVLEREHLPGRKLRVIPNAVDIPTERIADPACEPAVGALVANLIKYKGHDDLLAAMATLDTPPLVRLIGEGPERQRLEREIERLALADRVILEGHRPHAAAVFSEVQFALLTSQHEGLPNAVLEAMAAGLPVIATAVGGVPELIDHEVNGLLIPPGDPVALARAISILSGDADRRVEYGRAGRAKALRYNWEACRDAHLSLYGELLNV